jgi:SAM-dependent methyltransferase
MPSAAVDNLLLRNLDRRFSERYEIQHIPRRQRLRHRLDPRPGRSLKSPDRRMFHQLTIQPSAPLALAPVLASHRVTTLRLVHRAVDGLAAEPRAWDLLRWILEAGYRGEKDVLRREGITEAASILDLGCGTGAMAGSFRPESYVGVDTNARYIAHARSTKSGYRFEVTDGRSSSFADGSFDAVLIAGVIHHLDDASARSLLQESRRVLVPGKGVLVMWEDVPTRSRWNWIGRLVGRLDEGDFIRPPVRYLEMACEVFGQGAVRHYPMSSGVCDYVVIVAHNAT